MVEKQRIFEELKAMEEALSGKIRKDDWMQEKRDQSMKMNG